MQSGLAPLHHTAVWRHIDHQHLTACWVKQFVPQIWITERNLIRPQSGCEHSGQMRVVAIIQNAVQLVLGPNGAGTAAL